MSQHETVEVNVSYNFKGKTINTWRFLIEFQSVSIYFRVRQNNVNKLISRSYVNDHT